jgi:hypothetical protein
MGMSWLGAIYSIGSVGVKNGLCIGLLVVAETPFGEVAFTPPDE